MHSAYFTFIIMFFYENKCSYVIHNNNLDQMSNNIDMLMKPIKKLSGIFPNHEFELQFDLEHVDYERPSRRINYNHPSHAIIRSENVSKVSVSPETTLDPSNHVVYMKDLKKALEEYEKKHTAENCIKKELTTESPNSLSSFNDNPPLSDVLQLIKRGAKLQNDIPKPGDTDISWIKIKVPTE